MAESCAKSFGRYLRTLRERRDLGLADVASMSKAYADPVAKSYLSRVENGLLSLALPKMIPLCRIYEIPPEALVERLELDMELDKVGGPDTSGLQFGEMVRRSKMAYELGNRWDAYAYARDSVFVAAQSPIIGRLRDHIDQSEYAWVRAASNADHLGRSRFALHELLGVQRRGRISSSVCAILFDRLANTCLHLGQISEASKYADSAIEIGLQPGINEQLLGFFYQQRAIIARRAGEVETAISLHQQAFRQFRSTHQEIECARSLYALANAYSDAARPNATRRALAAAERLAARHGQKRIRGLIRMMYGELEAQTGELPRAVSYWNEALTIGNELNDKDLQFQAIYALFKLAKANGRQFECRALQKRLLMISAWLRSDLPELAEFRTSIAHAH